MPGLLRTFKIPMCFAPYKSSGESCMDSPMFPDSLDLWEPLFQEHLTAYGLKNSARSPQNPHCAEQECAGLEGKEPGAPPGGIASDPTIALARRSPYLHFSHGETEAQRGKASCPHRDVRTVEGDSSP